MRFYKFKVDSGGTYGENTVYVGEKTAHPCVVSHLHFEFDIWPEEELLACYFHYIGTERLKQALEALQPAVTGVEFANVEISGDENEFDRVWREGRPDSALGKWYWFKIKGEAGRDDFGGLPTEDLVISERVLQVLEKFPLPYKRDFQPWGGEMEGAGVKRDVGGG